MKRKAHLTSDLRAEVERLTKQLMAAQSDAICARAYNDFLVAMVQAGLSARTINRVADTVPMVEKYIDTNIRNPTLTLKGAGNPQNVQDADLWVHDYLTSQGIHCFTVEENAYND